jgi:magnesium chelatase subunit ChlD-like protein
LHSAARGGRWRTAVQPAGARALRVVAARAPSASIAWLPTLYAKGLEALAAQHLRWREPQAKMSTLHLVLLDTSGSMRQGGRLALAKGYAAQVLEQAARTGEHVALLCFGGQGVEVLVAPGPARRAAAARVQQRGGGGGTPLAQALAAAEKMMAQHRRVRGNQGSANTVLWLLTDGRTQDRPAAPHGAAHTVVVDFEDPRRALGRCAAWAARWGAEHRMAPAPR